MASCGDTETDRAGDRAHGWPDRIAPNKGGDMTDNDSGKDRERIPFMQRVLDNPFLLLFLGVVVPTVLYIIWGVMELSQIPVAP